MKTNNLTTLNVALAGAVGALGAGTAAADNPFLQHDLDNGYNNLNTTIMGKVAVGEGQCGEKKAEDDKQAEGKCGEGKCGEHEAKDEPKADTKSDKQAEGKCGEGKCGH